MPDWLPFSIFALACPVGMGLMMWLMMRKQHEGAMGTHEDAISPEEKLARLEAEKQALEQQIAAKQAISPEEKLVRLEAEKQALEQQIAAGRDSAMVGRQTPLRPQDK